MRRFFCFLLLCAALQAMAQPVRGLIVKLRPASPGTSPRETPQAAHDRMAAVARDAGLALERHGPVGSEGHHLLRLVGSQQGAQLDATVRRLRLHPDVLAVEPDALLQPMATANNPNDPGFAQQWHLQAPATFAGAINASAAWSRSTGTAAVTVAVLDTGILPHADLAGRYWPGYDFASEVEYANDGDGRDPDPTDPGDWVSQADKTSSPALFGTCTLANSSWHGSFIAGLIAAATNNGLGVAGVNWNNKVLPVRVSGKCGAFLSDILDAMRWAAGLSVAGAPNNPNPARIINLSFGGDQACTTSYQDAINEVTAAGVLVVVAAGNNSGLAMRPADCANVLAVGAVEQAGNRTYYSSVGPTLGLVAPGGVLTAGPSGSLQATATGIYSTSNSGTTSSVADILGSKQGTSFSAPLAAGVASLMLAINPSLSPAQLMARMEAGARPHVFNPALGNCTTTTSAQPCNCTTSVCGAGLLDADGALQQAANPAVVIVPVATALPGATISLDGRGSAAAAGASIVSYAWSQVSGANAALGNSNAALASVVLPGSAGSFIFKLKVTDSLGRSAEDVLTVTAQAPASTGGGGALGFWWGAALWLLAGLCYGQVRRRR